MRRHDGEAPLRPGSCCVSAARARRTVATGVVATCWLALAGPACGPDAPVEPQGPPNIVVVVADDQSWRDYGFMGSSIARTPNLDTLAASGTVFTHGFTTASACRPSLRSLLTGLEPQRLWALERTLRARNVPFPEQATIRAVDTLPRLLGEHGYATFQGGKHWEGEHSIAGFDAGTAEGFDAERAGRDGVLYELSGGPGNELGRGSMAPLLDFVTAHREERFFVWFAPLLPHTPHDPPEAFVAPYAEAGLSPALQRYFGNVSRLDARVGELLEHIEGLGLRERTLVLFVADNGWDAVDTGGPVDPSLGGPRGKFSIFENGFRTPLLVSWPGTLPAGRRHDMLVSTLDVMPTLLDYAGVLERPPDRTGVSLRAAIEEGRGPVRERLVGAMTRLRAPLDDGSAGGFTGVRDENAYFLREPGWRYVWWPARGSEALFVIDDDPWEQRNVASLHPERVERHRREVIAWRRRMQIPAPIRADLPAPEPAAARARPPRPGAEAP